MLQGILRAATALLVVTIAVLVYMNYLRSSVPSTTVESTELACP